ncbi:MAG: 50S ribosomal protein L9 [Planctomycetes bacterium]|nr:50S ribosomal protein L9 [Planctomycetota bacterium]
MANIEILLREHVQHLGKCGDVVRVKPGYARNFLFPNRLATEATAENKKLMARKRARLDVEEVKRNAEIDARVAKLQGLVLTCNAKADDAGHLFGSVSAAAILELLHAAGHPQNEKDVRLDAPIKTIGAHAVKIHVHGERFADITINVNKEG